MRPLANVNPESLADAVERLERGGTRAAAVGGGSDLLGMIKDDLVSPDLLVNLRTIGAADDLTAVDAGPGELRLGGLVTLTRLSTHPEVASRYRVLAEAAGSVGTPQIRNVGTLAGNLCQRPWCWYFRQKFPCYKHGGNRCYSRTGENQFNAIFGGGPSYIVHPSDTAPALVALDARFLASSAPAENGSCRPASSSRCPASTWRARTCSSRTSCWPPSPCRPRPSLRSTYAKVLDREAWTHAVVSLALALEMDGDRVRRAGVVLGGVAPVPWRVEAVEDLLAGQRVTQAARGRGGAPRRRRRPADVEEPLQGPDGREPGAPDPALAGRQRVTGPMDRRDFILLGRGRTRTLDVSCERLYMTFVEARMSGSTAALLARLAEQSARARRVRLRETVWLARADFRSALKPVLDAFESRGGTVEMAS